MEDEFFLHLHLFRNAELILCGIISDINNEGSQILAFFTFVMGVYKIDLSGTNMKAL